MVGAMVARTAVLRRVSRNGDGEQHARHQADQGLLAFGSSSLAEAKTGVGGTSAARPGTLERVASGDCHRPEQEARARIRLTQLIAARQREPSERDAA